MDLSSPHLPYIIGAYVLAASILTILICWTLQEDRKIRQQLDKRKSDAT